MKVNLLPKFPLERVKFPEIPGFLATSLDLLKQAIWYYSPRMNSTSDALPEWLDVAQHPLDRPDQSAFTDRFVHLFESVPNPATGRPWGHNEFAAAVTSAGCEISGNYVRKLGTGVRSNPSLRVLVAMCTVFQVPPGYFFQATVREHVDTIYSPGRIPFAGG